MPNVFARPTMAWIVLALSCTTFRTALGVIGGTEVLTSDPRFDGVGLILTTHPLNPCGGQVSGTCTLIAPDRVLIARHSVQRLDNSLPPPGRRTHVVRFRRAADGRAANHFSGTPLDCLQPAQEAEIQSFVPSPMSSLDMLIGVLDRPIVGILPVKVDSDFLPTPDASVILAGWGFEGRCFGAGDGWTLRSKVGQLPPISNPWPCCFRYNVAAFNEGCVVSDLTSAIVGNLHDSGAPIFIDDGSQLRMVAMVTSQQSAENVVAWRLAGGQPPLEPVASCPAEFDQWPGLTPGDLLAYMTAFWSRDSRAEMDGSAGVTVADLLEYLRQYFIGCV